MLWIKTKVGGSVFVGTSKVTLVFRGRQSVLVSVDGKQYPIARGGHKEFPTFTLHIYSGDKSLKLGFDAPQHISIRRAELET